MPNLRGCGRWNASSPSGFPGFSCHQSTSPNNAIAGYTCDADAMVSCPVHAFVGSGDRLASRDNVSGWADHTTAEFTVRVFEGNHFYFAEHLGDVVTEVETRFGGQLV